jgi:hypothetical protein
MKGRAKELETALEAKMKGSKATGEEEEKSERDR